MGPTKKHFIKKVFMSITSVSCGSLKFNDWWLCDEGWLKTSTDHSPIWWLLLILIEEVWSKHFLCLPCHSTAKAKFQFTTGATSVWRSEPFFYSALVCLVSLVKRRFIWYHCTTKHFTIITMQSTTPSLWAMDLTKHELRIDVEHHNITYKHV